jgi:WXXGXW repeat (2 copies)
MKKLMRCAAPALVGLAIVVAAGFGSGLSTAEAQVIVGERAMPAPRVEVVPGPRAGYAWVPGHWTWRRGGWVWIRGHHVRGAAIVAMPAPVVEVVPVRPSARHVWAKGHHVYEGGHWVWRRGVWVR